MSPYQRFLLRLEAILIAQLDRVQAAIKQAFPQPIMELYLLTTYPTIIDPNSNYAFGVVTATNFNQAGNAAIEALRATGLDIDSSDSDLVIRQLWDHTVPGVQLFIG